jgi:hypothetical protein
MGKILFRRKVVQYVSKTFKLDPICHEKRKTKISNIVCQNGTKLSRIEYRLQLNPNEVVAVDFDSGF